MKLPAKRKAGKPKVGVYKESFGPELVKHMSTGRAYETFAKAIGVHRTTLFDWETRYPEWANYKEAAVLASWAYWENKLHDHVENGTPLSAALYIFTMKSRFKVGLDATSTTLVQVKTETNLVSEGKQHLVRELKDVFVKYVDERKEPARQIDRKA